MEEELRNTGEIETIANQLSPKSTKLNFFSPKPASDGHFGRNQTKRSPLVRWLTAGFGAYHILKSEAGKKMIAS